MSSSAQGRQESSSSSSSSGTSSGSSASTSPKTKPTSTIQGVPVNGAVSTMTTTTTLPVVASSYSTSSQVVKDGVSLPTISSKSPLAPGAVMSYGQTTTTTTTTQNGPYYSSAASKGSAYQAGTTYNGATYGSTTTSTVMPSTTTYTSSSSPATYTTSEYRKTSTTPAVYSTQNRSSETTNLSNVYSGNVYTASNGYTTTAHVAGPSSVSRGITTTVVDSSPMERQEMQRQVSNVIIKEEYMGERPKEDQVTYVEVEVYEEVIKHVARKEIIEVEKRVPKYEYEWVERVVEIPQIQYVDKPVEVTQIQEVIRHVPRTQIVDVPREIIRNVPKIEYRQVEKVVEVPGGIIEVPKPYVVENKIGVSCFLDADIPVVVAQTTKPIVLQSDHVIDVDVVQHEPEVIPVDVHVIKPVASTALQGASRQVHRVVSIPNAQYNTILKLLNTHMESKDVAVLPYLTENNMIPFLDKDVKGSFAVAADDIEIEGLTRALRRRQGSSRRRAFSSNPAQIQTTTTHTVLNNNLVGSMAGSRIVMREGEAVVETAEMIEEAATIATLSGRANKMCCGTHNGRRPETYAVNVAPVEVYNSVVESRQLSGVQAPSNVSYLAHAGVHTNLRAVSASVNGEEYRTGVRSKGASAMEIRNYEMNADGQLVETAVIEHKRRACC